MPALKEPHFFARDFEIPHEWCVRDERRYLELFAPAGDRARVGEASVWYLFSRTAANEIRQFDSQAKIIVMLRDPINAMYSLHGEFLWNCNEDILDFAEALAAEADREKGLRIPPEAHMPAALLYTRVVDFGPQVQRYFDVFGRENVLVILLEEFANNESGVYRRVLRFLGLDDSFEPRFRIVNCAKPITPRFNRFFARRPRLRGALHKIIPNPVIRQISFATSQVVGPVVRPRHIDFELRARLMPHFRPKIEALARTLDTDLSHWLQTDGCTAKC